MVQRNQYQLVEEIKDLEKEEENQEEVEKEDEEFYCFIFNFINFALIIF